MSGSLSPRLVTQHRFGFFALACIQPVIQFRALKFTCLKLSQVQVSHLQWKCKKSESLDISVKISTVPEAMHMILGKSYHFNQKWEIELFLFVYLSISLFFPAPPPFYFEKPTEKVHGENKCNVWVSVDIHNLKVSCRPHGISLLNYLSFPSLEWWNYQIIRNFCIDAILLSDVQPVLEAPLWSQLCPLWL